MAVPRTLDIRWVRRYRLFCIGGCVILAIQVFLAFKFINIDSYNESSGQDLLSGRGRLSLEVNNFLHSKFVHYYVGRKNYLNSLLGCIKKNYTLVLI